MSHGFKILTWVIFIAAIALRFFLFLSNPPENSFDDHFSPVYLMMQSGKIPPKNACLECIQPPIFYGISAMVGELVLKMGINKIYLPKILQFLCFLYGSLQLGIIYLILNKIKLSPFSKAIAFTTVCFLPQHIYISAMHSNDTLSYLLAAICIYLLLIVIERNLSLVWSGTLSIAVTAALFTKYFAFALIPTIIIIYIIILSCKVIVPAKKVLSSMAITLLLPVCLLGWNTIYNISIYNTAMPSNASTFNPALTQPHAKSLSFTTFKPWVAMDKQILCPELLDSFWTLLYSKTWFDVEPKFLYFTDPDNQWWYHYYCWIRGEEPFPGKNNPFSSFTRFSGFWLIALGIFPFLVSVMGFLRILFGKWGLETKSSSIEMVKMQIFPVLLIWNLVCVIAFVLKYPVFSAIKASYLLISLPAFAVFLGVGLMACERYATIKKIIGVFFIPLFILVTLHILHIVQSAWGQP